MLCTESMQAEAGNTFEHWLECLAGVNSVEGVPMLTRLMFQIVLIVLSACCGCNSRHSPVGDIGSLSWDQVVQQARGTTVRMAMWDGDPLINAYMRGYVHDSLAEEYGVDVQFVGGQGKVLVDRLLVELDAGRSIGDIDVVWINGETFYQLRQIEALYGPFTDQLPNHILVDWGDPYISIDFQQPIAGYECPWGNVQQAIIYQPSRVAKPPQNTRELAAWVKLHPGRFTFDNSFTGMTFLKCLLVDFAGGAGSLDGPFDEPTYHSASVKLWQYLRELQPFLWRKGQTFPESVAQLHQLFTNGEVDFTMSNNDGEVDNKALQGIIPETSCAYVWESGTIRNSHYLGVPLNGPNRAAALVLINFLISPAAQLRKATPDVWGDGTILDITKLPEVYQAQFANIPGRKRVPARELLATRALREPAPEVMIRLQADFRKFIIEGQPF